MEHSWNPDRTIWEIVNPILAGGAPGAPPCEISLYFPQYLFNLSQALQLYLYGDPAINNHDNKTIILATIKYIRETRRFST